MIDLVEKIFGKYKKMILYTPNIFILLKKHSKNSKIIKQIIHIFI